MKILFYLTRYPGYGGIETVTRIISDKLRKRGYEIDIVSHIQQEVENQDDNVFSFPDAGSYYTARNMHFFENLLDNGNYDAIVYQDSYAPSERIVVRGASNRGIPLYVFEHNSPNHIYIQNYPPLLSVRGILARLNFTRVLRYTIRKRYLIKGCNKYILLSNAFKPELQSFVGRRNMCKVGVINNPMKDNDCTPVEKEKSILFVGRFVDTKRVDMILDIWERLSLRLGDWKLILVGDGPMRSELEMRAAKLPRVEFAGFQNPLEYYKKSRIFLMVSKFEGWSMTLCEAMQQGCVPVAFDTYASLHDIVSDGETGFIVKPNNMNEFIEKISLLASDLDLYSRFSNECRQSVERFSAEKIADEWETLLSVIR